MQQVKTVILDQPKHSRDAHTNDQRINRDLAEGWKLTAVTTSNGQWAKMFYTLTKED